MRLKIKGTKYATWVKDMRPEVQQQKIMKPNWDLNKSNETKITLSPKNYQQSPIELVCPDKFYLEFFYPLKGIVSNYW